MAHTTSPAWQLAGRLRQEVCAEAVLTEQQAAATAAELQKAIEAAPVTHWKVTVHELSEKAFFSTPVVQRVHACTLTVDLMPVFERALAAHHTRVGDHIAEHVFRRAWCSALKTCLHDLFMPTSQPAAGAVGMRFEVAEHWTDTHSAERRLALQVTLTLTV